MLSCAKKMKLYFSQLIQRIARLNPYELRTVRALRYPKSDSLTMIEAMRTDNFADKVKYP